MTAVASITSAFRVTLHVKPVGKARPRMMRSGHVYTPQKTINAEAEIRWLLQKENPPKFEGPVSLQAAFYVQRPKSASKRVVHPVTRPDIDNYLKLLLDAANGILFKDDNQVVQVQISKAFGDPRIDLCVVAL